MTCRSGSPGRGCSRSRTLLTEHGLKEVDDAYRDAAALLERNPESFGYRSVVVDEGQDMSAQAFRLIRGIVPQGPNDLFIVEGLEFDRVIIASVNDGLVPLPQALAARGDEVGTREADLQERALLYVAATRAKREAVVTSYGKASPYVAASVRM